MYKLREGKGLVFHKKIAVSIFSLLFLLSFFSGYQKAFASEVSALVETKWLADNLKKPEIRIVYVASMAPKDKENFDIKHIPGSVYVGIGSLMNVLGNGSMPPDKAKFEALMGKLGIGNDTHVVVSGAGGGNPFIANAFWLMKYFGHKKVSYLNGGTSKWMREKNEITGKPAQTAPATYKATLNESIFANADYVLKNLKNPKVAIVDTRGLDEYTGKNAMGNKRTGHIPGAILLNFYPTNLNKDGTFKSVNDLKAAYEAKGVTKDKEVITYCQGGIRAAHTYFVLKHLLGYPKVRNYVGSWGEWGSRLDPAKYPLEK